MRKILFLNFLLVCVIGVTSVVAQDRKITGKVTAAEDGSALPGVSVVVKGTSKGVNTDGSGSFSIDASTSSTLVFSFVGTVSQEIPVGNKSVINVTLAADTKQLSEVVVTAVGIQRDKKALAFAVSNVKGTDLQQRSEPDPLRALSGKVPGVNITAGNGAPGAGTRITIRGNNSFTGNNQPLFVDNKPKTSGVRGGADLMVQVVFKLLNHKEFAKVVRFKTARLASSLAWLIWADNPCFAAICRECARKKSAR